MVAAFAGETAYVPGYEIKPYRSLIEVVVALLGGVAYVPYQGIKPYRSLIVFEYLFVVFL